MSSPQFYSWQRKEGFKVIILMIFMHFDYYYYVMKPNLRKFNCKIRHYEKLKHFRRFLFGVWSNSLRGGGVKGKFGYV